MDRYGGGYLYKGYAAQNGVRTAPVSGDWSKRGSSRPDDRVRTSLVPDPASGTNPSDGEQERRRGSVLPLLPSHEKESNLAGKNMAEMAYSPHLSKHSFPKKVDHPVKDHMEEAHQRTSPVHRKSSSSQRFDDFIKKVHDEANQPHGSAAPGNSHQPPYSSSVNGIPSRGDSSVDYEKEGHNKPTANGSGNDDYGEYIRKSGRSLETNAVDHGGWSRPIRPTWRPALSPQANGSQLGESTTNLDKPSYSSNPNGLTYSDDYNGHRDKDREKPAGNMTRNGGYGDYYRRNEANRTTISNGAWARPRHVAWASPPDNGTQHVVDPTYNISKQDMDSLREPTKLTSTAAAQSAYSNGSKGYGDEYTDRNTKEGNGNYYQKNGSAVTREPTTGNWTRPNFSSWISPPRNDTQVTQPTNDIGKVIGFLNEAVNPTSGVKAFPRPRYSVPISTAPNKDAYQETIDRSNLDNGRRYGNFKFPSQPR